MPTSSYLQEYRQVRAAGGRNIKRDISGRVTEFKSAEGGIVTRGPDDGNQPSATPRLDAGVQTPRMDSNPRPAGQSPVQQQSRPTPPPAAPTPSATPRLDAGVQTPRLDRTRPAFATTAPPQPVLGRTYTPMGDGATKAAAPGSQVLKDRRKLFDDMTASGPSLSPEMADRAKKLGVADSSFQAVANRLGKTPRQTQTGVPPMLAATAKPKSIASAPAKPWTGFSGNSLASAPTSAKEAGIQRRMGQLDKQYPATTAKTPTVMDKLRKTGAEIARGAVAAGATALTAMNKAAVTPAKKPTVAAAARIPASPPPGTPRMDSKANYQAAYRSAEKAKEAAESTIPRLNERAAEAKAKADYLNSQRGAFTPISDAQNKSAKEAAALQAEAEKKQQVDQIDRRDFGFLEGTAFAAAARGLGGGSWRMYRKR